jgi:hypothetical protein
MSLPLRFLSFVASVICVTSCTTIPAQGPARTHEQAVADLRSMLGDLAVAQTRWQAGHRSFASPAVLLDRAPRTMRAGVVIDSVEVSSTRWYLRVQHADTGDRCWASGGVATHATRRRNQRIVCTAAAPVRSASTPDELSAGLD